MKLRLQTFTVHKKFALQISRTTTAQTTNLWLRIEQEQIEGWGEASPFSIDKRVPKNTARLVQELESLMIQLANFHPLQRQEIATVVRKAKVSSAVQASVDMALHDWLGKKVGLPLWQIWGLSRDRIVPISVTIGIGSPDSAINRLQAWQETLDVKMVKLKLGSPQGIEADKEMLEAIRNIAPQTRLLVDANGGWSFDAAVKMSHWLAERGVEYIEQPLPPDQDSQLGVLSASSPLPIYVDESCFNSQDILRLANSVAGVNLKIMKTGGLTKMIQAIQVAKACNLKVMFGCYSDSGLANTAMAHLSPLADYLDLDSHLNLADDPFRGAVIKSGRLLPNHLPGLGVEQTGGEFC